jgi:hypothetical protein
VNVAYLQKDLGLLRPTFFLAVQESIEETQLLLAAIIRVEMRPVFNAVRLKPFLFGRSPDEPLKIATGMQALAAPIRRRE